MNANKKVTFVIIFSFLMLLKASAFHVYTHHDTDDTSIEKCNDCILAVESQQAEHHITSESKIPTQCLPPVLVEQIIVTNVDLFFGSPYKSCLFSRPPPSVPTIG